MSTIPTGTERLRPFVPAQDFDRSRRFYEAVGFEKVLDGEVAIFNVASGGFILQRYYQKDWAENCMMQNFAVQPPKPPAMQPWGLRVAYVYDPSGVLWHVAQRRTETIQDR